MTLVKGYTWHNAVLVNHACEVQLKYQVYGKFGVRWEMYLAKAREVEAPWRTVTLVKGYTWRNAVLVNHSCEVQVKYQICGNCGP